jgi:hypothetical protein
MKPRAGIVLFLVASCIFPSVPAASSLDPVARERFLTDSFPSPPVQEERVPEPLPTYELYSWRHNNGGWSFSIFGTISRMKAPEEVFDAKEAINGVDGLKQKLLHLVRPSRIIWIADLGYEKVGIKVSERLELPPQTLIEEIKRYAARRHIEIVI